MERQTVTPYNKQNVSKTAQVEEMFDHIAHRYDFLNRLLSLGIDKLWRKKAVRLLKKNNPKIILDVATGTGDFAFESLTISPQKIIAYDLSENMLAEGRKKAVTDDIEHVIEFVKGDSEKIPYPDHSFDAVTIGFGVRNFEHLHTGLQEIYRVLRPQSSGVILEVSQPHHPVVRTMYSLYFKRIIPLVGKYFSRDSRAYSYLPESVQAFPQGKDFVKILETVGFKKVYWKPLTLGTCALYYFEK